MTSAGAPRRLGPSAAPRADKCMSPELAKVILKHREKHPNETMRETHAFWNIKILLGSFTAYMNKFKNGQISELDPNDYGRSGPKPRARPSTNINVLSMKW